MIRHNSFSCLSSFSAVIVRSSLSLLFIVIVSLGDDYARIRRSSRRYVSLLRFLLIIAKTVIDVFCLNALAVAHL